VELEIKKLRKIIYTLLSIQHTKRRYIVVMTHKKIIKEAGWKYLLLALGAFTGLGLEAVHAYGWEPIAFGAKSFWDYTTWQAVLHWVITCFTWVAVGYLLVHIAKDKLGFDIWEKGHKMKHWQVIAVLFGITLSLVISYIGWDGFKVVKELQANGVVKFIFQYIYYMVETVLFLLIIVFGQKAVELWTKKRNVPWGGIICGLTWGIAHLVSRGVFDIENGMLSAISGLMFGAAYLLTNRDIKKSWFVLFFMFVL
jgi:hypothetical protein